MSPVDLDFAPAEVDVEYFPDGSMILRSPQSLLPYERQVGNRLRRAAKEVPAHVFLAERNSNGGWKKVTYAEAEKMVDSISQSLLDRGMSQGQPLMILSQNSIKHALMTLGAMQVGVPVVPVSVAYSTMSSDYAKLKHIFALVRPRLVFVENFEKFGKALAALEAENLEVVSTGKSDFFTSFEELISVAVGPQVEAEFNSVGPETVAKYLFTSGSTGMPKGVINTQKMLCANQQMIAQTHLSLDPHSPVVMDWLPWNHTMGGNGIFNYVLWNQGTFYIDSGRPLSGMFDETLRNLREVSPTRYYNVPAGLNLLVQSLEKDTSLCKRFFQKLSFIGYGGASLPQDLWDRLGELGRKYAPGDVVIGSGWGATETAPSVTAVHWKDPIPGVIGLPLPGAEVKFLPHGDKLEMRVRGPMVTPGYLGRPDLTAEAFDEEGFYKIGDAGRLADPDDPAKGIVFDGRVSENFKLSTGTWVTVGPVRIGLLAALSPLLSDALIAGENKDFVSVLGWPNIDACRVLCGEKAETLSIGEALSHTRVRDQLRRCLRDYNAANPGSSTGVQRILLLAEPPSFDGNEITDKGYINQSAGLRRRADFVEVLFTDPVAGDVIVA